MIVNDRLNKHTSTTVWNSLPAKCRNCLGLTVETFRKHVKTYLFETVLSPPPNDWLHLRWRYLTRVTFKVAIKLRMYMTLYRDFC